MTCSGTNGTNGWKLDSPNSKDHELLFYANYFHCYEHLEKNYQKRRFHLTSSQLLLIQFALSLCLRDSVTLFLLLEQGLLLQIITSR